MRPAIAATTTADLQHGPAHASTVVAVITVSDNDRPGYIDGVVAADELAVADLVASPSLE